MEPCIFFCKTDHDATIQTGVLTRSQCALLDNQSPRNPFIHRVTV